MRRRRRRNPSTTLLMVGAAFVVGGVALWWWRSRQAGVPMLSAQGVIALSPKPTQPAAALLMPGDPARFLDGTITPAAQYEINLHPQARTGRDHF